MRNQTIKNRVLNVSVSLFWPLGFLLCVASGCGIEVTQEGAKEPAKEAAREKETVSNDKTLGNEEGGSANPNTALVTLSLTDDEEDTKLHTLAYTLGHKESDANWSAGVEISVEGVLLKNSPSRKIAKGGAVQFAVRRPDMREAKIYEMKAPEPLQLPDHITLQATAARDSDFVIPIQKGTGARKLSATGDRSFSIYFYTEDDIIEFIAEPKCNEIECRVAASELQKELKTAGVYRVQVLAYEMFELPERVDLIATTKRSLGKVNFK